MKNSSRPSYWFVQYGIILFWACWFSLVFSSDFIDFLQHIFLEPKKLSFTSHNAILIAQSLSTYHLGQDSRLVLFIFGLINISSLLVTGLLWWACWCIVKGYDEFIKWSTMALYISFIPDAFFVLCDEVFIQYNFEHDHLIRLSFRLLTFLVFKLSVLK